MLMLMCEVSIHLRGHCRQRRQCYVSDSDSDSVLNFKFELAWSLPPTSTVFQAGEMAWESPHTWITGRGCGSVGKLDAAVCVRM